MIAGTVYRKSDSSVLINNAWKTQTAWERMRGLLGRDKLEEDEALLITPCSSIHTIGMAYPLDVIYLDKEGAVLKTVSGISPYRFSLCPGGSETLELCSGFLDRCPVEVGDILEWRVQE